MEKNAKIYVAGHRGLVGSAIWNNLRAKGYTSLVGRTHAELDLLDGVAVKRFFDEERPDYVILAAAHVGGIMANNTYRADFISTCIYPRDCPQPIKEEYLLTGPLEYTNEPYALSKIVGLKMCESFNLQYGTNYLAVMPTNLYGPNDNFHLENSHVMPAMIRKIFLAHCLHEGDWKSVRADLDCRPVEGVTGAADKETIEATLLRYGIAAEAVTLWGTGRPLREFLWSEEMADASVFVMEQVDFKDLAGTSKEVRNCHINIGTGKEISIGDLARLIVATIGYRGRLQFDATKPDGTPRKLCDVTRLHRLGWHHKIEIEEGVKRLYHWYCQSINPSI